MVSWGGVVSWGGMVSWAGVVSWAGLVSLFLTFLSFFFSCERAEIKMSEDSVGESVEFSLVNFTWSCGVNSLSSGLDPSPLIGGEGVILGSSELFNSVFDFSIGEGSVMVGIESRETLSSLFLFNANLSWTSLISLSFLSKSAEIEMFEDSVGECVEFSLVNFTWSCGVNFLSGSLDPSPFFFRDGVMEGFSDLLNTNLDFIVGERSVMVGIESRETLSSEASGDTTGIFIVDSDGRGGGDKGSDGEFHFF